MTITEALVSMSQTLLRHKLGKGHITPDARTIRHHVWEMADMLGADNEVTAAAVIELCRRYEADPDISGHMDAIVGKALA